MPEWTALGKHREQLGEVQLRELFADGPGARRAVLAPGGRSAHGLLQAPGHRRDAAAAARAGRGAGVAGLRDAMFRGEKINITEDRAVLHTALRAPRTRSSRSTARTSCPAVHAVLDEDGAFADRVRSGEWTGLHRQADQHRRQHRHRRLGPGPGDGVRGAARLHRPGPGVPLRLQRGRRRPARGGAGPGPGRDAVHRRLQDLHHHRDDHQRDLGARLAAGRPGRRRRGGGEALRRAVDQRREGLGVRHRHRPTCSSSGTGSAAATPSTRRSACR